MHKFSFLVVYLSCIFSHAVIDAMRVQTSFNLLEIMIIAEQLHTVEIPGNSLANGQRLVA